MQHSNTYRVSCPEVRSGADFPLCHLTVFVPWLAIVMIAYSLERLQFLGVNWSHYSGQSVGEICRAMLLGLRFDLAIEVMMASPLLLILLAPFPMGWRKNWNCHPGLLQAF